MKGTVPSWLEPLLGLEPAESGEGTVWTLDYHWPWPAGVTLLAGVAVVALVVFFYLREAGAQACALRLALVGMRCSPAPSSAS